MAIYALTLLRLQQAVQLIADRATDRQLGPHIDLINEAMLEFVAMRPWQFMVGALSLDVVQDQNYVALPSDFQAIKELWAVDGAAFPTALDQLVILRANTATLAVNGSRAYYYSVSWTSQASAAASPIGRLEIFPTPTAAATGVLVGRYYKMIPALAANTDVPNIPSFAHPALRAWVEAYAAQQLGIKGWDDLLRLAQEKFALAAQMDGGLQTNRGRMRGSGAGANQVTIQPTLNVTPYS